MSHFNKMKPTGGMWNQEPMTLERLRNAFEEVGINVAVGAVTRSPFDPQFGLPTKNELLFHPEDFDTVPSDFICFMTQQGITVACNRYLPQGYILATGTAATVLRDAILHRDVQHAMAENKRFLELLRRNNLA